MDEPSLPTSARGQELYLDYTMRTLQRQATVLGELRTRANILLSASGVVAGLFGPPAFADKDPEEVLYIAAAALVIGVALCVRVLWPVSDQGGRRQWRVTLNEDEIRTIAGCAPPEGAVPVAHDILEAVAGFRVTNHNTISSRTTAFNWACVLLPIQVGAWFAVLYF